MTNKDIQPEIEALQKEIEDLKKSLRLTIDVLNDTVWALRSFKEQRLIDAEYLTR
jgi:peptidoglycan hydrolase CwlO-like protein